MENQTAIDKQKSYVSPIEISKIEGMNPNFHTVISNLCEIMDSINKDFDIPEEIRTEFAAQCNFHHQNGGLYYVKIAVSNQPFDDDKSGDFE